MNSSIIDTRTRPALTLLELLVVIVILGLLTATVTTRIADTLGPAALKQSVSQLEFTDHELRGWGHRTGKPVSLHFEIGANRLEFSFDADQSAARTIRSLGRGVRITKYISSTQEVTYGPMSIGYDDRGGSETYAMEFTGRRDARRWIMVAGLTGQLTEVADEARARELLQLLLPRGVHAG